ncbi:hypothetical protein P8452_33102 [Trifolium repens]|nr:hypothetical protein P8452_33102 [Trifolium repens]
MVDIMKIELHNFCVADIRKYEFVGLDVAYMFYCWFAKLCGFSVRKGHVVKNRDGNIIQHTFLCSSAGFREDRGLSLEKRKGEVKNETRCGCDARFKVPLDIVSMRWYVTLLEIDHKHDLLGGTLCGLQPTHRKMSQSDINEIERNRKAGIRPHIGKTNTTVHL